MAVKIASSIKTRKVLYDTEGAYFMKNACYTAIYLISKVRGINIDLKYFIC